MRPCTPAERDPGYLYLEFHGMLDTKAPIDGDGRFRLPSNKTIIDELIVKYASWSCNGLTDIIHYHSENDDGPCWPSTVGNDGYTRNAAQCQV